VPNLASETTEDLSFGMLDSAAPTAFPRTAVAALYNARLQPDGTVQRRPGSIRLSAAALFAGTGYGGVWYTTAAGVDQFIAIFGAHAFYTADYGATWSAANENGAGVNTCVYASGPHTITTVMDTGIAGTHTWDLTGITGSMTMTPVVTGSPIATCVSTDNAGTYTAGAIKVTVNGVLYTQAYVTTKDDTLTALAAQLPVAWREDYYSFAIMRVGATNYLYAANGDTTVKRWNGTTWDTNPNAPSGVKFLDAFNGRLIYAGHSGVLVQGTKIGDPSVLASPDGWTVQVRALPTAMFQVGPHLLIWDKEATSYIDGYGEQTIIVAAGSTGFSRSVGCMGFRTVAGVGDNAVCWLSRRGVEYYSPNSGITLMSRSVQRFLLTIDWEELYANPGRMSSAYDDIEQNYHLALSTNGARNNRTLVLNIRQNAQWQRSGPTGACTIDQPLSPVGGDVLLGSADGVYLDNVVGGLGIDADADGYATLSASGFNLAGDLDGYLSAVTDDSLPATLFAAPGTDRMTAIYSLGYDGYVRRHDGVSKDDEVFGGTGGTDVTMTIVSRPFLVGRARQRKRVRIIHVSAVTAVAVTIDVAVRGGGVESARHTLTFAATGLEQSRRKRALVSVVADDPQCVLYVTADCKVSLIGISAELLREAA
jgi:hypothetical protein